MEFEDVAQLITCWLSTKGAFKYDLTPFWTISIPPLLTLPHHLENPRILPGFCLKFCFFKKRVDLPFLCSKFPQILSQPVGFTAKTHKPLWMITYIKTNWVIVVLCFLCFWFFLSLILVWPLNYQFLLSNLLHRHW